MESTIVKAVGILLAQPEEMLIDKDHWIVNYIVKAVASFSKICTVAVAHRNKDYTEAKKEDLGLELTKILYFTGCLTHLCEIEPSTFDADSLTEFSVNFDPDYQQDSILCAMLGMRSLMDISEELYVTNFVPGESLAEGVETPENPEEEENVIEQAFAEIFACVIILCEHFELDLEIVMSNVAATKKP